MFRRNEKQGIGEQGDRKTEEQERERMRGESFFWADKNRYHGEIQLKVRFDKMKAKSDEKMKEEWKTRLGFFGITKWTEWKIPKNKKQKNENEKKKRKNEETEK